ncbi:MAG TPA: sigma-70 family RNA polymerase sigma factor [Thermoanaerobaculia bacterium]|jgi:RNA polymerase sigma-70 factor (ECF subfamily)
MNEEIAELVVRARDAALAEQHAAFGELVTRFEELAFVTALRALGDAEEARDAAQEAFLTAWLRLRQLREPAAFGVWLTRIVRTSCNRRLRARRVTTPLPELAAFDDDRETRLAIARAVARLSASEQRLIALFYDLGHTLDEIAALLHIARGTAGKRLYEARLKIRAALPRSLRDATLPRQPLFARAVRAGLFDEYAGVYRFAKRPELVVTIVRERDQLVSYGGGQRNVLASLGDQALATSAYDGEGRFRRDRKGRISGFVYYEFGRRLGVAEKVAGLSTASPPDRRSAARAAR